MGYLRKRFGEASTYNGIAIAVAVGSLAFPQHAMLLQAIAASLGVVGVAVPEAERR